MITDNLKRFSILTALCLTAYNAFAAGDIAISRPSCKYTVRIPDGWDTIPADTLKSKLHHIPLDAGVYPATQNGYFGTSYALTGFMPTLKPLSELTFGQIVKELEKQYRQSEITSDTLTVRLKENRHNADRHIVYQFFSIRKDTVAIEHCQVLFLTRFGYVTVMYYTKTDAIANVEDTISQINAMITIQPEYVYVEHAAKGLSIKHIAISLLIGLVVYGLITVLTKKRAPSCKR